MKNKRNMINYTEYDIINAIKAPFSRIIVFDEIDSTNTYIKQNASGLDNRTLVFAKKQTGGRGRLGRNFISPDGGLYFSILLKNAYTQIDPAMITVSAAVAVSDAIKDICGIKCDIKWVNDIYISGKKVCGILAESASSDGMIFDYTVVGIGINLYTPSGGFSNEIKDIATSLQSFGDVPSPSILAGRIYDNIINAISLSDHNKIISTYKERSYVIGKNINIIRGDSVVPAKAIDILDDASLLVEYPDKRIEAIFSGDVSIRM